MTLVMTFAMSNLHFVQSGILQQETSSGEEQAREIDNFVEFIGEGDQLAVESTGDRLTAENGSKDHLKTSGIALSSTVV